MTTRNTILASVLILGVAGLAITLVLSLILERNGPSLATGLLLAGFFVPSLLVTVYFIYDAKKGALMEADSSPETPHSNPAPIDETLELQNELLNLVGNDGGFSNRERIRMIGERLNEIGGIELMQEQYGAIRQRGVYFSQDIWDRIGRWRA